VRNYSLVLILLPLSILAQGERIVVQPADNNNSLSNPGMGWGLHHYDNGIARYGVHLEPFDTVDEFPGLTHIYLRLA
jgi:hypothetical protein